MTKWRAQMSSKKYSLAKIQNRPGSLLPSICHLFGVFGLLCYVKFLFWIDFNVLRLKLMKSHFHYLTDQHLGNILKKVCDRPFPHSLKKFRVWEKSLRSERFKLKNSINNKKGLFSYSKNVYKFQISKRALIWAKSKYWFLMPKIVFWRNSAR